MEQPKREQRTIILYESPHRLLKSLKDVEEVLGDPVVVVARELTKKFEEVKEKKASELLKYFIAKPVEGKFALFLRS